MAFRAAHFSWCCRKHATKTNLQSFIFNKKDLPKKPQKNPQMVQDSQTAWCWSWWANEHFRWQFYWLGVEHLSIGHGYGILGFLHAQSPLKFGQTTRPDDQWERNDFGNGCHDFSIFPSKDFWMKMIFSSWILLDPNKFESNLDIISNFVCQPLREISPPPCWIFVLKRQQKRHSVIFGPGGVNFAKNACQMCVSFPRVFSGWFPFLHCQGIILKHPSSFDGRGFSFYCAKSTQFFCQILLWSFCFFHIEQKFLGVKWWDFSGGTYELKDLVKGNLVLKWSNDNDMIWEIDIIPSIFEPRKR